MARAAPTVPNTNQPDLSPCSVSILQISVKATATPAMGVHSPAISRVPAPINSMAGTVTFNGGGSLNSVKLARTTSADPTTSRIRSKPVPGQPPANVEYSRRTTHLSKTQLVLKVSRASGKPKESQIATLLEWRAADRPVKLQLDDSALQPDHGCLRSVAGA